MPLKDLSSPCWYFSALFEGVTVTNKHQNFQVVRHGSSILANLANSSLLLEGQLIEVPGLGNGSSVCSDDSRAEDFNGDHMLSSPRLHNYTSFRQAPIIVCTHHHACVNAGFMGVTSKVALGLSII